MNSGKLNRKLNEVKKGDLRTQFKVATANYLRNGVLRQAIGRQLVEHLRAILPGAKNNVPIRVGAFRSKDDEVDINTLFDDRGWFWAFPRVQGDELEFFHPKTPSDFVRSEWGIDEPHPLRSDRVEIASLDVMLVPGLAFDRHLNRLGRGRGYYDRALKSFKGLKIGVASVEQIASDELPCDPHDAGVDLVVTDKYVLRRMVA